MLAFFPVGPGSRWGLQKNGWSWDKWWSTCLEILEPCGGFRAFDIVVLVLELMQEKGDGLPIKEIRSWNESGRLGKLKKQLMKWGDFKSDTDVLDILSNYNVMIG